MESSKNTSENIDTLQVLTDVLSGIAIALGNQIDAKTLASDLRALGEESKNAGHIPSGALLQIIATTVELRVLGKR